MQWHDNYAISPDKPSGWLLLHWLVMSPGRLCDYKAGLDAQGFAQFKRSIAAIVAITSYTPLFLITAYIALQPHLVTRLANGRQGSYTGYTVSLFHQLGVAALVPVTIALIGLAFLLYVCIRSEGFVLGLLAFVNVFPMIVVIPFFFGPLTGAVLLEGSLAGVIVGALLGVSAMTSLLALQSTDPKNNLVYSVAVPMGMLLGAQAGMGALGEYQVYSSQNAIGFYISAYGIVVLFGYILYFRNKRAFSSPKKGVLADPQALPRA